MVDVSISGASELRRVAAQLRAEHRSLQRKVTAGTRKAIRPLEQAIRAEIPHRMPHRYAAVLEGAIKVAISIRSATGIRLTIKAMGRRVQRDVNARNLGSLRHKLFGDRNHWYDQAIRPGFVTDPVRASAEDIYRELENVAEGVRARVERG
jgi:hypothetical protein